LPDVKELCDKKQLKTALPWGYSEGPKVMGLADENTLRVRSHYPEVHQEELENGLIDQNPLIISYPATNRELETVLGNKNRHELLQPICLGPQ
jgi:hypothetical protein